MANENITIDIVAKEAMSILNNELGVLDTFYRAYENEFDKKVNGYEVGETISIRRPADPRPRRGITAQIADVVEGKLPLTVDQVYGHDFRFSSTERTMKIEDLSERVIKPAMMNIINLMVSDILTKASVSFNNWIGISGTTIDSFADVGLIGERMDELCIPQTDRNLLLHTKDHWALMGTQVGLYMQGPAKDAYRDAMLGRLAKMDTYSTALVPRFTNGTADITTPLVRGASQNVTYSTAKNSWTQTLITDGWDASATIKKGQVFTIADCYMVNPRTKARTEILQQFVVTADVTADGTPSNATNLTISPPIITSGTHQTVEFTSDMDDNAIVLVGAASGSYRQNMAYHKNAIALAVVPMVKPEGAVDVQRQSMNGLSIRMIPSYDGINDLSHTRLDILCGFEVIQRELGVRASATG